MATGWLRGRVKAVTSGDTLVIMANTKGDGIPPEKTITLSSLIAPKLARRDTRDEPFAWESREFLRKMCIGKEVTFKVDYVVTAITRDCGSVFLRDCNVATAVVTAGWAKVRQFGQAAERSPFFAELVKLEEQAKEQGIGMWNKQEGAGEASKRNLPPSGIGEGSTFDAMEFVAENKGNLLHAIVEHVRDGSTLRAYILPQFQFVQIHLAGIQAPSMGRRGTVVDAQIPIPVDEITNGDSEEDGKSTGMAQRLASLANTDVPPDPFAVEAKHFTECRLLNRDVRIIVETADKFNNLVGSISYEEGEKAVDLGLELVKQGLAKCVEWSTTGMDDDIKRRLKAAELQAKKDRLRIWVNYVPPPSNSTAIRNVNFTGKVVEVVSGDCLIVTDDSALGRSLPAERRINLSSIRAPKMGNPRRNEKPAAYAREAKEFLRALLIGKQVSVSMEYSRKVVSADGAAPAISGLDRVMDFGSVFLLSKDEKKSVPNPGQPAGLNVAEMIVAKGFAEVVRHRDFEERSNYYEALLASEVEARKQKHGCHSAKAPPAMHINDLSMQPNNAQKAKQFLPFLRAKRLPAIVDFVLSGHRFKLVVPKETCALAFALSGVRCPARGEEYADEALAFMKHKINQHDVEIEVEAVDGTGTFLGTLWESKANVALSLLEAGLAKLQRNAMSEKMADFHLLAQAEQLAKQKRLKIWEKDDGQEKTSLVDDAKSNQEVKQAHGTVVLGGGKFYARFEDSSASLLQQQLEALKLKDKQPHINFEPKKGDTVLAQFSADDSWNRALVVSVPRSATERGEYEVFYIDYGNQEMLSLSRLRPMDPSISTSSQGLAHLCSLAHIKVPELDEDFGEEAAEFLSSQICEKKVMLKIEGKDMSGGKVKAQGTGTKLIVTVIDVETSKSINASLLEAGLAKLEKKKRFDSAEKIAALESLSGHLETARKARLNIWQYGDVESDDEDVVPLRKAGGRR